jgi:beta-lactamase superfamily II metal-dependent hydrolase
MRIFIFIIAIISTPLFVLAEGNTESLTVDFLNVGQGESTLITCPNNNLILVDFGSTKFKYDLNNNEVREKYLIITHPHQDHYNKSYDLDEMTNSVSDRSHSVKGENPNNSIFTKIYSPESGLPVLRNHFKGLEGSAELFKGIKGEKDFYSELAFTTSNGTQKPPLIFKDLCGENVEITVIAANRNTTSNKKNNMSIVLAIKYLDQNVALLTGDASEEIEKVILDKEKYKIDSFKNVTVLSLGHHGSSFSTSESFTKHVNPRYVIASSGLDGRYLHPRCDVVDRFFNRETGNNKDGIHLKETTKDSIYVICGTREKNVKKWVQFKSKVSFLVTRPYFDDRLSISRECIDNGKNAACVTGHGISHRFIFTAKGTNDAAENKPTVKTEYESFCLNHEGRKLPPIRQNTGALMCQQQSEQKIQGESPRQSRKRPRPDTRDPDGDESPEPERKKARTGGSAGVDSGYLNDQMAGVHSGSSSIPMEEDSIEDGSHVNEKDCIAASSLGNEGCD